MGVSLSYIRVAERAAREAGAHLLKELEREKEYEYKYKNSMVTEVDVSSEDLIIDIITSEYPTHSIVGEERGEQKNDSHYRWIIDPIDGTTNYLHRYPYFSVSIGLEIDGVVSAGVVYNPIRDELFSAEIGKGAFMNGKPIKPSRIDTIEESLLTMGVTHKEGWMVDETIFHLEKFIYRAQGFRRDGSAALDLSYVAMGRVDGFWEIGLHCWDVAAGSLILTEAGGAITDFSGGEYDIYGIELLATNALIHDEMIEVLLMGRELRGVKEGYKK